MKTLARTSLIVLLGILLTGCTVTTKNAETPVKEQAYSYVLAGCYQFNKGEVAIAATKFAYAAQLNPEYLPVLEKMNALINVWLPGANIGETTTYLKLFCSAE